MVLVGNKADLERIRVVTETQARSMAEKYNIPYIETSVVTGQNVKNAFDILLDLVMNRWEKFKTQFNFRTFFYLLFF